MRKMRKRWRSNKLKEEVIRILKENNGSVGSVFRLRQLIEPRPGSGTLWNIIRKLEEEGRLKLVKEGRAKKVVLASTERISKEEVTTEILKDVLKLLIDGKTQEAIIAIVKYLTRKGVL
ncbi:hypothetical protein DRJ19_02700 [Candidatus Woesearchaeota archaeon]|nr:MAG: hypothetical protein DRJ19_02700 [Candidatus Woesearchaeota archaeon]